MVWSSYQGLAGGATSYGGANSYDPATYSGMVTSYDANAAIEWIGSRNGGSYGATSYSGLAAPVRTLEPGFGGGATSYTGAAAPVTTQELGFGGVTAADPMTTQVVGGGAAGHGGSVGYGGAGAPRGGKSFDTLIIFDYDDTLLCSTALDQQGWTAQGWTAQQLHSLETAVKDILQKAMSLGETIIVTNGSADHVQDSSRRFLPNVQPLLSRLRVISARDMYEHIWPGDGFAWKEAAFTEILSKRCEGKSALSSYLNLVVLGDSLAEINAAHTATANLQCASLVKTINFKEVPSANELLGELQLVTQKLADVVLDDASSTQTLYLSGASGWRIAECRTGNRFSGFDAQPLSFAGA